MYNYIAYSMVNMYIGGIHAGIQSGHSLSELALSQFREELADQSSLAEETFIQWLVEDKTHVVKNGGDYKSMHDFINLCIKQSRFPYASFEETGLGNNVTTSISIILPDLGQLTSDYRNGNVYVYDDFNEVENQIIRFVNNTRLAT